MTTLRRVAWPAGGLAGCLAVWAFAAMALGKPYLLPSPWLVGQTVVELRGALSDAAVRSLSRVGIGWLGAVAVALPLGWGLGAVPALDRELRGLLALLRPLPPFAWLPLLLLWVGVGEATARWVCFAGALFPILAHAREGVAGVPPALLAAGRNLGAAGWRLWWHVRVPAALPLTCTGLRLGWTLAWMSVVAAELVGADGGLGQLILDSRNLARADIALAGMATLGAVAAGSSALLRRLERRWGME